MEIIKQYLKKQGKTQGLITESPSVDLELIVVIPAYKEPNIIKTLESLSACSIRNGKIEVLIYINGSSSDTREVRRDNDSAYSQSLTFAKNNSTEALQFHILKNLDLPSKKSGVGLARKVLMDEALLRFQTLQKEGVIVNLDADCTVSKNYFESIIQYFEINPHLNAASIHIEHELSNPSIINYELHLRYFIGMQKLIGCPFAFQTVGSAMAVRTQAYAALGGMNTRRAGEDFYFLHKFIKNGTCGELSACTVYPEGRISDRVPFGTGKAVGEGEAGNEIMTYHPSSFTILQPYFNRVGRFSEDANTNINDDRITPFLERIKFKAKMEEINKNTSSQEAFIKRYFQYFDAFKFMKALHFLRDTLYQDVKLDFALDHYFEQLGESYYGVNEISLSVLRKVDKKQANEVRL
ncbi:glycosyltransferase [Portibacter marinus]|uniref:glycosyltransferase n=1 Tax=Portibacter marinus TaxID=2898660 RepID=UPI001F219251|nr:glycosyltransferase [Portibacter marinus]